MNPAMPRRLTALTCWALLLLMLFGCQRLEDSRIELTQSQWEEVRTHHLDEAPDPDHAMEIRYHDSIELIGVDVDGDFAPGEEVELTWYWRVIEDVDEDWQIFVHFDSHEDRYRQNLDHYPLGERMDDVYRTYHWEEGQVIADPHEFVVQEDYPVGEAAFYVGLFRGEQRAPITDGEPTTDDNRAIGPTVDIHRQAPSNQQVQPASEATAEPAERREAPSIDRIDDNVREKIQEAFQRRQREIDGEGAAAGEQPESEFTPASDDDQQ